MQLCDLKYRDRDMLCHNLTTMQYVLCASCLEDLQCCCLELGVLLSHGCYEVASYIIQSQTVPAALIL